MNCAILLFLCGLVIVPSPVWPVKNAADVPPFEAISQSGHERCFQGTELSESLTILKQQSGPELQKVTQSLFLKARSSTTCRTQIVQSLIRSMEQASRPLTDQNENYFLWQHGASLLANLKATEALDLLIANIDLTDGWSTSISESHSPAVVAIFNIGEPAIQKLQIAVINDPVPHRRRFAALAIAYIGGRQARLALTSALPTETEPCTKEFLRVSLQAFDNKARPNHISTELNSKWLSTFYCL